METHTHTRAKAARKDISFSAVNLENSGEDCNEKEINHVKEDLILWRKVKEEIPTKTEPLT